MLSADVPSHREAMGDDMEEAIDGDDFEIDLDYEFDAPLYFDFIRPELHSEAHGAQLWFQTARSYPPSPLITEMDSRKIGYLENINTLSNFEEVNNNNPTSSHSDVVVEPDFPVPSENYKGLALQNCVPQDAQRGDKKSNVKCSFPRGSTLMKPTASHLAKQNRSREMKNDYISVRRLWVLKNERNFEDPNDNASQAAKRQKLEGGHILKVPGVKQQTTLTHKVPKKKKDPHPADCDSRLPRLKLTIPREPVLETAKRATTFRAQRLRSKNAEDLEDGSKPTTSTFKARPLNRKILEAPSLPLLQKSTPRLPNFQEFHLKTHERAIQHSLATASSLIADVPIPDSSVQDGVAGSVGLHQPSDSSQLQTDDKKLVECGDMSKFKARPFIKKMISSKGNLGIFRSTKREITKPKEFKFSTNRKCQQSPLTELFNKLSLASEVQHTIASQTELQQSIHVTHKVSKENMINLVH